MRLFIAGIALLVAACSQEQSTSIGAQPKKTMDSVSSRVNQAMQQSGQGSERLKEGDEAN